LSFMVSPVVPGAIVRWGVLGRGQPGGRLAALLAAVRRRAARNWAPPALHRQLPRQAGPGRRPRPRRHQAGALPWAGVDRLQGARLGVGGGTRGRAREDGLGGGATLAEVATTSPPTTSTSTRR
jgi:hypothetical protein